jgi:hypothetical protein
LSATAARLTPRKIIPPTSIPPVRGSLRTSEAPATTVCTAGATAGANPPLPLAGEGNRVIPATAVGIDVAGAGDEDGGPDDGDPEEPGGDDDPGVEVDVGTLATWAVLDGVGDWVPVVGLVGVCVGVSVTVTDVIAVAVGVLVTD